MSVNKVVMSFMQLHSPNIYDSPPTIDLSFEEDFSLR